MSSYKRAQLAEPLQSFFCKHKKLRASQDARSFFGIVSTWSNKGFSPMETNDSSSRCLSLLTV